MHSLTHSRLCGLSSLPPSQVHVLLLLLALSKPSLVPTLPPPPPQEYYDNCTRPPWKKAAAPFLPFPLHAAAALPHVIFPPRLSALEAPSLPSPSTRPPLPRATYEQQQHFFFYPSLVPKAVKFCLEPFGAPEKTYLSAAAAKGDFNARARTSSSHFLRSAFGRMNRRLKASPPAFS